jgi:hypothetical protein
MTCSASMQIYRKSRCQEAIVSKVKTQRNFIKFPESA